MTTRAAPATLTTVTPRPSDRACGECGGPIPPSRPAQARYCGDACKKRSYRTRHPERACAQVREANARRYAEDPEFRRSSVRRTKVWRHRKLYGQTLDTPEDIIKHAKDRYRRARAEGYRSGLEVSIARSLEARGVAFQYEPFRLPYRIERATTYTPDVVLPNGIIVELKGRFVTADRQKMKLVAEQHPDLDIRIVFSNSRTKISKASSTTYAMWSEKYGFPCAENDIPTAWLKEAPNEASLAAIARLRKDRGK